MRYPRKMTVELTAKCNFRCPYCYCVWHEFPQLAGPELDTDGWKGVLDRFAADGVKAYKLAKLEVSDFGRAAVNADVQLKSVKYLKLAPGTYTIDKLAGVSSVYDSSAEQTGSILVTGGGLAVFIR